MFWLSHMTAHDLASVLQEHSSTHISQNDSFIQAQFHHHSQLEWNIINHEHTDFFHHLLFQ